MNKHGTARGLHIEEAEEETPPDKNMVEANLKKRNIPKSRTRTLELMDKVGADLQEIETLSYQKEKHLAVYVEYASNAVIVNPLKKKSDQKTIGIQAIRRMERIAQKDLQILQVDQGGEYMDQDFLQAVRDQGGTTSKPATPRRRSRTGKPKSEEGT